MAKDIKCAHCNSRNLVTTNQKGVFQCNNCKSLTDLNGNRFLTKVIGFTVGTFLTTLTLGLIPDEVQDQISEVAGEFVGDLLS
jgi:hypothetical protein